MKMTDKPESKALLERLQRLSAGLFFLSESDHPFEVMYHPEPPDGQDLNTLVPLWLGMAEVSKVEVEDLPYFFRHHTSKESGFGDGETFQRFRELQAYLKESLREVKVYR